MQDGFINGLTDDRCLDCGRPFFKCNCEAEANQTEEIFEIELEEESA